MAIARDYGELERRRRHAGLVKVLSTGWVYRWSMGRWLFVRD
jgi:hypothetical protein